ncbi:MAG TPA: transcriptional regulator, partial [Blastocatellia bacterium]|nr:transcriptional regulator [Blastocatellia bacterium]
MTTEPPDIYEFGRFRLDAAEHTLWRGGELVPLTPKVFGILLALVENSGRVVGKDELMRQVWPDSFVEEGNLTQNVSLLRKALGETGDGKPFIETVARRGYRFVASVTRAGNGQPAAEPAAARLVGDLVEAQAAGETPARSAFAVEPLTAAGAMLEGAADHRDN